MSRPEIRTIKTQQSAEPIHHPIRTLGAQVEVSQSVDTEKTIDAQIAELEETSEALSRKEFMEKVDKIRTQILNHPIHSPIEGAEAGLRSLPVLIPELVIDRNPRSPIRTLPSVEESSNEHPQIRTIRSSPTNSIGILRGIIRTLRGR